MKVKVQSVSWSRWAPAVSGRWGCISAVNSSAPVLPYYSRQLVLYHLSFINSCSLPVPVYMDFRGLYTPAFLFICLSHVEHVSPSRHGSRYSLRLDLTQGHPLPSSYAGAFSPAGHAEIRSLPGGNERVYGSCSESSAEPSSPQMAAEQCINKISS